MVPRFSEFFRGSSASPESSRASSVIESLRSPLGMFTVLDSSMRSASVRVFESVSDVFTVF